MSTGSVAVGDAQHAAIGALAKALRAARPTARLDQDGRVENLEDNLVSGITEQQLTQIAEQIQAGDGGELVVGRDGRRPKMHAAHSSSALAVNVFGWWLGNEQNLPLAGSVGFDQLVFEEKVPTGLRGGTPPHLDVIARRSDAIVAIESKCTEYLSRASNSFSPAYDRLVPGMHPTWAAAQAELKARPDLYRVLGAAQLIKHYLGLKHTFPEAATTLLYLFWEPANPEAFPVFAAHRAEVAAFADGLEDPVVKFRATSYPELWKLWTRPSMPAWVAKHVAELRSRYAVAI